MDKWLPVLGLAFAIMFIIGCSSKPPIEEKPLVLHNSTPVADSSVPTVCTGERCISVELAITQEKQEEGLMYRANLSDDSGMLFIFNEEDYHAFWMKNTLIPLDMVWIDAEGRIVYYHKDAQPCLESRICPAIVPNRKAIYVLESNSGYIDSMNLSIGDELDIRI